MAPSLGIQPVGAVSLLHPASSAASTTKPAIGVGVVRAVPIDRKGKVTGRSWCRWDGATYGQSAPASGRPQQTFGRFAPSPSHKLVNVRAVSGARGNDHFVGSSVACPPTHCQRPFRWTKISVMRRGPGTYPFA